jgi:hypothetical protein
MPLLYFNELRLSLAWTVKKSDSEAMSFETLSSVEAACFGLGSISHRGFNPIASQQERMGASFILGPGIAVFGIAALLMGLESECRTNLKAFATGSIRAMQNSLRRIAGWA